MTDYDTVTLNVAPGQLYYSGQMMTNAAVDVVDALNAINTALNGLQLGWAGSTAAEAKDFADQWTAAMTLLFGDGQDPTSGTLPKMVFLVNTAAGNFGNAEQSITQMFTAMYDAMTANNTAETSTAPISQGTSYTDSTYTAVGESNWTSVGTPAVWPTVS